jgi:hypothetical protein
MRPLLFSLVPIAFASSCASATEGTAARLVRIDVVEGNRCVASIDGMAFDPADETAVYAAFPTNSDNKIKVHIIGGSTVPYRCIGGLIYTVQTRGYGKIAFMAEPPASSNGSN